MQTLRQLADGPGDAADALYVARRKAIESKHSPNDDGTEQHFFREHGPRDSYADDLPDPIGDHSPIHCLAYYGIGVRQIELLERHGCETIGDVRTCLAECDIVRWSGGERKTEQVIREAVEAIPE